MRETRLPIQDPEDHWRPRELRCLKKRRKHGETQWATYHGAHVIHDNVAPTRDEDAAELTEIFITRMTHSRKEPYDMPARAALIATAKLLNDHSSLTDELFSELVSALNTNPDALREILESR